MKKIFFFLLLLTSISITSCNKDDDEPKQFMTATIDGNSFEATTIFAISDEDSTGETFIFARGDNSDNSFAIGLNMPANSVLGETYAIDENDLGITFTDAAENAFFTVGELTLEKHDTEEKVIEGTFSFTATQDDDDSNVIEVTNGAFKIPYL